MSDFVAFSEEIDVGMEFLEHHGILGMKHGKRNGPPYPLGSGDHSSAEKSAAKAAGVKIGKSSGKGSIDNIKKPDKPEFKILQTGSSGSSKSAKKEMTEEERRAEALKAASVGDKKKITKNMDQLSTDELRDAKTRADLRDALTAKDPNKKSKADKEKEEAMKSGDKEKVRQYADKMTYAELNEAMNKIDLMQKLNYEPPPPTALDRIKKVAETAGKLKDASEKAIGVYNNVAKIYNATHKDSQWPIIGEKPKEEKKDDDKKKDDSSETTKAIKEMTETLSKEIRNTREESKKEAEEAEEKKPKEEPKQEEPKAETQKTEPRITYRDWDDDNLWNSVADVDNTRSISDELTPAEEEFLNSFKKGR